LFISRSHYALGKTKWPLFGNLLGGVVSVVSAFLFIKYFGSLGYIFDPISRFLKVSDLTTNVLALPLAYSLGSVVSAIILFLALGDVYSLVWHKIKTCSFHTLLASIFCATGAYWALDFLENYFNLDTFWGVLGQGAIAGIFGILMAVLALKLLRSQEYIDIKSRLLR
jgi:hypothetical protein